MLIGGILPCPTCSTPTARCSTSTPPSPATARRPDLTPTASPKSGGIKQIEYTWTHTLAGRYVEFWTLTQRALDYCFERFPSVDRALRADLLDAYLKLDAFPDARRCCSELKARGERTAILTNGSPAMVASAVEAAGLKAALDAVLSVDAVKMFKPRPEVYALVTAHFACKPADVVFVSSNRWDAMGATAFGFRTVWVNRAKAPDEYPRFPAGRGGRPT